MCLKQDILVRWIKYVRAVYNQDRIKVRYCLRSSVAERLLRKQQVVSSTLTEGFSLFFFEFIHFLSILI